MAREACSNETMRLTVWAPSALVLGLNLAMPSLSRGQDSGSAGSKAEQARPPNPPGRGSESRQVPSSRTESERATARAPEPAASRSVSRHGDGGKSQKGERRRSKVDPKRPLVQAPSFQLMDDGTTVVSLAISGSVAVSEKVSGKKLEYRIKSAQVGIANNLNPLVTAHFQTPLVRAALRRERDGIVLVMQLRENAAPKYVVRERPNGAVLEITLPRPTRAYRVDAPAPTDKPATPAPDEGDGPGPNP